MRPIFLPVTALIISPEYRNKTITRIFGSPKAGCYFLAVMIFLFGVLRDYLYVDLHTPPFGDAYTSRFHVALAEQPKVELLPEPYSSVLPLALMCTGQLLVVSSTWALGITGTFLGDYFGILMDHRVEGCATFRRCSSSLTCARFPFNVLNDPMYVGSTMCFLGGALWSALLPIVVPAGH